MPPSSLVFLITFLVAYLRLHFVSSRADRSRLRAVACIRLIDLGLCLLVVRVVWHRAKRLRWAAAGLGYPGRLERLVNCKPRSYWGSKTRDLKLA